MSNKEKEVINLYLEGKSMRTISSELHISRETISTILKNNNIDIRRQNITSKKYFCNKDYFENIDNEDKAYWLGFITADGYIENKRINGNQKLGITLSFKDKNHLLLFNQCLESNYPIKDYIGSGFNKDGRFSRILITSQKLVDDLKKWNIVEHKTNICKFPFQIPNKFYLDFIRGYLDGDGSIYQQKDGQYRIEFLGTKEMLNAFNYILNKNNQIGKTKGEFVFELKYGGNYNCYNILKKLYENKNIKLERKYNLYLKLKKYIER